jgi:hypothetical protein
MFSAAEFRKFASEAIEAARNAPSDNKRKHHLDMARMWTKAAAQMDGGSVVPSFAEEPARESSS